MLTRQAADIHLLEVLSLEDDDGELARVWHVTQREANVTELEGGVYWARNYYLSWVA